MKKPNVTVESVVNEDGSVTRTTTIVETLTPDEVQIEKDNAQTEADDANTDLANKTDLAIQSQAKVGVIPIKLGG